VNNAGVSVFGAAAAWDALDAEAFQRIHAVNAVGTFQMVRACLQPLKEARGSIVKSRRSPVRWASAPRCPTSPPRARSTR